MALLGRFGFLVLGWALIQAQCATPLGPGFEIQKQAVELTYSATAPNRVHVRAWYRLKNDGNSELTSLNVRLPAGERTRDSLRIAINRTDVRPRVRDVMNGPSSPVRDGPYIEASIPFGAWRQKQKRELMLEYDVALPAEGRGGSAAAFYLASGEWFPDLAPPEKLFARGTARGEQVRLAIRVPTGWRALSSGRIGGSKGRSGSTEHRFLIGKDDFAPFVLAGWYHEQRVAASGQTISLWTLTPVANADAQAFAMHLAPNLQFHEETFGPRERKQVPIWIAEVPAVEPQAFARGVLVGNQSQVADETPRRLLPPIWTHQVTEPAPESSLPLSAALADAAAQWAAEEAAGSANSNQRVAEALARFDAAQEKQGETRDRLRADLLVIAMEERVGRESLRKALHRVVQARRGQEWNLQDLRSALEAESGQNLGEFFRVWLSQPGVPEEFRKKHAQPIENRK